LDKEYAVRVERQIGERVFWFTIERPYQSDDSTGQLFAATGYYCESDPQGAQNGVSRETVKQNGRTALFASPEAALEAGVKLVKQRLGL